MAMEGLYLIAHKVRGEVALDIALPLQIGQEMGWIIPTSGHRAYPWWTYPLNDLIAYQNVGKPPPGLRDHYEVSAAPPGGDYTDRAPRSPRVPTLEDI